MGVSVVPRGYPKQVRHNLGTLPSGVIDGLLVRGFVYIILF